MPSRGSPLALYFVLAYAISWVTWAPVILARFGLMPTVSAAYLHLAGGLLDIFMMSPVSPNLPGVMGALLTIGSLLVIPKLWARRAADPHVQPASNPADEHRNVM